MTLRHTDFGYFYDEPPSDVRVPYRSPVCTEDIQGIAWQTRPARVVVSVYRGRPVSPHTVPPAALHEIERAIMDQGWRYGVKSVSVSFVYDNTKGIQLVAEITYGR